MKRLVGLAALLILGVLIPAGTCDAGDPKPSAADAKRRTSDLRKAVRKWYQARTHLIPKCDLCRGSGRLLVGTPRRPGRSKCTKCKGRKVLLDWNRYRMIEYDLKSPAFRAATDFDLIKRDWRRLWDSGKFPPQMRSSRIMSVSVPIADRGIVKMKINGQITVKSLWIYREDAGGAAGWFLHDSTHDGPWTTERPPEKPKHSPLPAATIAAIKTLLEKSSPAWTYRTADRVSDVVTIELAPSHKADLDRVLQSAQTCAVAAHRDVHAVLGDGADISIHWMDQYRDKLGRVAWKARQITYLARDAQREIIWENLEPAERLTLLDPRVMSPTRGGAWKLWRPKK